MLHNYMLILLRAYDRRPNDLKRSTMSDKERQITFLYVLYDIYIVKIH